MFKSLNQVLFVATTIFSTCVLAVTGRIEYYSSSHHVLEQPAGQDSTGLNLTPSGDQSVLYTNFFRMNECQVNGTQIEPTTTGEFGYLSAQNLAHLNSAASLNDFPNVYASVNDYAVRSIYCGQDENDKISLRLRAPFRIGKDVSFDFAEFFKAEFPQAEIVETNVVYMAMVKHRLLVAVDLIPEWKDAAGEEIDARQYKFLEFNFEKSDVTVKDVTSLFAPIMYLDMNAFKDLRIHEIASIRSINNKFYVQAVLFQYDAPDGSRDVVETTLVQYDPETGILRKGSYSSPKKLDDHTLIQNRYLLSTGADTDLGGGVFTAAGHILFDLQEMREIPGAFKFDVDKGCEVEPIPRNLSARNHSTLSSSFVELKDEVLILYSYILRCRDANTTSVLQKVKANLFHKTSGTVVNLMSEDVTPRIAIPEIDDPVSAQVKNGLISYSKDGKNNFIVHNQVRNFQSEQAIFNGDVRYEYDPVTKTIGKGK